MLKLKTLSTWNDEGSFQGHPGWALGPAEFRRPRKDGGIIVHPDKIQRSWDVEQGHSRDNKQLFSF